MAKHFELELSAGKLRLVAYLAGGVIEGRLTRETCPECNSPTCILDCEASQAGNKASDDEDYDEEYREAISARLHYNGVLDAIEALALAHACGGIDVCDPRYVDGIETVLDAAANNLS